MTITAATLTGEWVLAFRKRHKLSRDALMREGGFEGKSGARIMNIETKNAWKPNDRERIMSVVERLEPAALNGGATSEAGPDRAGLPVDDVWAATADADDDVDAAVYVADLGTAADDDCATTECAPLSATTVADDELDDAPGGDGAVMPVATPTDPTAQPLEVSPEGANMPRGWEHLYPPTDARHVHQFDTAFSACSNVTCGATATGAPLVEQEPDDVARLLAVADGGDEHTLPFGRPALVLPNDGLKALTSSELRLWRRCRRAWYFAVFRALRPAQDSMTNARATGDRVHRALAAWYAPEGTTRVDPRDALERVIVEDWTKIYRAGVAAGMDDAWMATRAGEFATVNALERIMIDGYVQWLDETGADAGYEVISSEEAVSAVVDVPGTTDRLRLLGRLDARFLRVSDGSRLFVDHKTTGNMQAVLPTLRGNPQMLHYELLEFLGSSGGDLVDGALYNMLKKVKRTVRATPPFYDRVEVRHNRFELESYLKQTLSAARDLAAATAALEAGYDHQYVVPPTKTDDCRFCDFFSVCNLLDDGSRVEDALAGTYVVGDPLARYAEADGIALRSADGTTIA